MADTAVTERRIRPIVDLLSIRNYKQALKECEKWQKKGECSDRFLALKAAVLLRQSDNKQQQERGAKETLQLCQRTPPITNFDAIHQLLDSLKVLSLEAEQGPKLWERAVAARPNDTDLINTWFNDAVSTSNWPTAQKATMAFRKAFPKERKYDFWNILMCYLIHEDDSLLDKDRKLFGTLANRMIGKAAQPGQGDKAISSPEELTLYAVVLIQTGNIPELLNQLQADHLSPVRAQDPEHADTLLLQAAEAAGDCPERTSYVNQLVSELSQNPSQDDRVFSVISKAINSTEMREERLQQIEKVIPNHPKHRQALLAQIDLLCDLVSDNRKPVSVFLDACREYRNLFCDKAFCFDDLISRLRRAGAPVLDDFVQNSSESVDELALLSRRLLALKFEYNIIFADSISASKVLNFADRALQLYKSASDVPDAAAEAGLLAAMALLQLSANSGDLQFTLRAALILHSACSRFKDYYPLRMLLVQVQMISGQISLGIENFMHLSVKNLQWETLGHYVLTRISTLDPSRVERRLNPLGALEAAFTVFKNSQRSLNRSILEGLENENYSNVVDTVEIRANLQRSIVKQIYTIEERKCHRAIHPLETAMLPTFESYQGKYSDLRDEAFMPKYGVDNQTMADLLRCGPRPSRGWLASMTLQEELLGYLANKPRAPGLNSAASPLDALAQAESNVVIDSKDLTEDEGRALSIYCDLVAIILKADTTESSHAQRLRNSLSQITDGKWKVSPASFNDVQYPDWRYLHHQHIKTEVLRNTADFATFMLQKSKAEKGNKQTLTAELMKILDEVQPLVIEQISTVEQQIKGLKDQLSSPGVLGKLVDGVLGRVGEGSGQHSSLTQAMTELQDEADLEHHCGAMRDSWGDALKNLISILTRGK